MKSNIQENSADSARTWPAYMGLHETGELQKRARLLNDMLTCCQLCPHDCRVDRTNEGRGFCAAPDHAYFSASYPHHGNEGVISGYRGSGNIFMTFCNSRCVFCQNHDISQLNMGDRVSVEQLASMYLKLQDQACHNVDFVTPQHFLPQIVSALVIAVEKGLRLPLVYNSNGYDSLEVLRILDGIFDIYLPDMKFSDEETARKLTGMKNYPEASRIAVAEMFRQVGPLQLDEDGIARKGLIVRHLVMPNGVSGAEGVLDSIAAIDKRITVNLMAQYHPAYKAGEYKEINRRILRAEYERAAYHAKNIGLENIWIQNVPISFNI
jgi:putative pyruvate formate lyase activating enzyme